MKLQLQFVRNYYFKKIYFTLVTKFSLTNNQPGVLSDIATAVQYSGTSCITSTPFIKPQMIARSHGSNPSNKTIKILQYLYLCDSRSIHIKNHKIKINIVTILFVCDLLIKIMLSRE